MFMEKTDKSNPVKFIDCDIIMHKESVLKYLLLSNEYLQNLFSLEYTFGIPLFIVLLILDSYAFIFF